MDHPVIVRIGGATDERGWDLLLTALAETRTGWHALMPDGATASPGLHADADHVMFWDRHLSNAELAKRAFAVIADAEFDECDLWEVAEPVESAALAAGLCVRVESPAAHAAALNEHRPARVTLDGPETGRDAPPHRGDVDLGRDGQPTIRVAEGDWYHPDRLIADALEAWTICNWPLPAFRVRPSATAAGDTAAEAAAPG